jgi:hypothetical protein
MKNSGSTDPASSETMRSKEKKDYHSSDLHYRSSLSSYFILALANKLSNIYCDHRLPSFSRLDVQEASKLTFKFTSLFVGQEIFRN